MLWVVAVVGLVVIGLFYRIYQVREDYILDFWESLPERMHSITTTVSERMSRFSETIAEWLRVLWED